MTKEDLILVSLVTLTAAVALLVFYLLMVWGLGVKGPRLPDWAFCLSVLYLH